MQAKVQINPDQLVQDLQDFIKIPSCDEGENTKKALEWALKYAQSMGMDIYQSETGQYGYVQIGTGNLLIGALGHVDVRSVKDEDRWTYPPFQGIVDRQRIYGRGSIKGKGPIVSLLHAMAAAKINFPDLPYRMRLILVTDANGDQKSIKSYLDHEEVPQYSICPDYYFPYVFAEKGVLKLKIISKKNKKNQPFIESEGHTSYIPSSAVYKGHQMAEVEKEMKRYGFDYEKSADELIVIGRSAHVAKPEKAINPLIRLMMVLKEVGIQSNIINFISDRLGYTQHGEFIFGSCYDDISGKLGLHLTEVKLSPQYASIHLDVRVPVTISRSFVEYAIERVIGKYGLMIESSHWLNPVYLSEELYFTKHLMKVYEKETHLKDLPYSIGHTTLARAIPNCVAFGPLFPGQKYLAHRVDENMDIKSLVKSSKIYYAFITELDAKKLPIKRYENETMK